MNTTARAWYREPWTWMLIGLPASAVAGSLTSAFLALQGADPIVADDYYQRGLQINTTLAQMDHAAAWGVHASLEADGLHPGETLWVRVRSAQPIRDTAVHVRLIHPSRGGIDHEAVLARLPSSADTAAEFTGAWPALAGADSAAASAPNVAWRVVVLGEDWRVEGDYSARNDLAAR